MSQPYSFELIGKLEEIARETNIKLHRGVYAAMSGPSLETRAEYRFLRTIGADVVGMSTVPEAIVANQAGLKVLGISIITDECDPDNLKPASIDDIIATAQNAEPKLTILMKNLVANL
jgi:purine-nucleoside phosphorylase